MDRYLTQLQTWWNSLQPRERLILGVGGPMIIGLMFIYFILMPWHKALNHMEGALPGVRENLVWMQKNSASAASGISNSSQLKGQNQSLLSVLEQTAQRARVRSAIQQLVPAKNGAQVRVVMEEANFNQWLAWIDVLYLQYGVKVIQATAERDEDRPNLGEIRATFSR